jgi:hypothetical protein
MKHLLNRITISYIARKVAPEYNCPINEITNKEIYWSFCNVLKEFREYNLEFKAEDLLERTIAFSYFSKNKKVFGSAFANDNLKRYLEERKYFKGHN